MNNGPNTLLSYNVTPPVGVNVRNFKVLPPQYKKNIIEIMKKGPSKPVKRIVNAIVGLGQGGIPGAAEFDTLIAERLGMLAAEPQANSARVMAILNATSRRAAPILESAPVAAVANAVVANAAANAAVANAAIANAAAVKAVEEEEEQGGANMPMSGVSMPNLGIWRGVKGLFGRGGKRTKTRKGRKASKKTRKH